jgi:hypothetical protein
MANVPINRTRALVIVAAPQVYAPSRVRDAANYLLMSLASTEEERRQATEAIEWLRGKRDEPRAESTQPPAKPKRKGKA